MSLLLCALCMGCIHHDKTAEEEMESSSWSNPDAWYSGSMATDTSKLDVFYLVSTDVVSAEDSLGNVSLCALLTDEDKEAMDMELQFVKDSMFQTDFNFISPYYHQYTFDCFTDYPEKMDSVSAVVGDEVCQAFDYYMAHFNHGRRFILAGFSQGGEMAVRVLRHMTSEQYSRMVAAYVIGFKVTADDTLNYATIRAAKCETDTGVTVSFNSVLSMAGIWDFVTAGTVACINPINWQTDSTSATFTYENRQHRVHVDTQHQVLVVDTDPAPYNKYMRETPPYSTSGISIDCLHHWDLLFYCHQIHDNAMKRCKKFGGDA